MKKQTVMALALAAAMVVPAAAQQNSNEQTSPAAPPSQTTQQSTTDQNTQNAPAATNSSSSTNSTSDQNMGARQPLAPPPHEGFWGHLNPFARKKYVQRQMSPIRDRVNELDDLSAKNSKAITDVDQRAQEGIRNADAKAQQADQHAVDAGNRAQQANQTAQQASTRLGTVEQVVTNIDQYKPVTQTEIRFRPGQAVLSQKAKDALDEMATPLKNQRGYVVEVQGFSSGKGQTAIQNSHKMADSVVRYLVLNHEIPVYRIFVLGMGNTPRPAAADETGKTARRTSGGRVEISLLKNDIEQLSAQNTAAPAGASQETGSSSNAAPATQGGMSGTSTATPAQPSQPQEPAAQPAAPAAPPSTQNPPQR